MRVPGRISCPTVSRRSSRNQPSSGRSDPKISSMPRSPSTIRRASSWPRATSASRSAIGSCSGSGRPPHDRRARATGAVHPRRPPGEFARSPRRPEHPAPRAADRHGRLHGRARGDPAAGRAAPDRPDSCRVARDRAGRQPRRRRRRRVAGPGARRRGPLCRGRRAVGERRGAAHVASSHATHRARARRRHRRRRVRRRHRHQSALEPPPVPAPHPDARRGRRQRHPPRRSRLALRPEPDDAGRRRCQLLGRAHLRARPRLHLAR